MNKLLLCTFLLLPYFSHAQNWQCVNSGTVRYFLNDEHYLRAIKIDSVKLANDDTIIVPFRTPRGDASNYAPSNTMFKGNWLGDKIIIKEDGENLFVNDWNDTIRISTLAALNDTWIFYSGKDITTFFATVTSVDTMTILGVLDSIKTFNITAKQGIQIFSSHPAHGKKIIISKEHGFVQVFELFLFPYKLPGSSQYLIPPTYDEFFEPANGQSLKYFVLTDFHNPTKMEIFNYSVGDILQYHESKMFQNQEFFISDEIINKTVYQGYIEYEILSTIETVDRSKLYVPPYQPIITTTNKTYKLTADSTRWLTYIPESKFAVNTYYFPNDTSFCMKSALYTSNYRVAAISLAESRLTEKIGVGTVIRYSQSGGGPIIVSDNVMTFYSIGNNPCGIPKWPVNIKTTPKPETITISPNPADDNIRINIPGNSDICQLLLTDMMGKTITQFESNKETITIPVNNIPQGIYSISIRLKEMLYHYKIAVRH